MQNYAPSCAGLHAQHDAQIDSSIVAGNFSIGPGCVDLAAAGTISGTHNLVGVDNGGLPQHTIVADPRLAPLADHGRFTRTHALLANSPAVDAGADTSEFITDPRGDGFARNSGSAVDIGAYKRQVNDDEIFFGVLANRTEWPDHSPRTASIRSRRTTTRACSRLVRITESGPIAVT